MVRWRLMPISSTPDSTRAAPPSCHQDRASPSNQALKKIVITGPDKQLVGQFAAEVREKRPPEPYKGKGIKYRGEYIFRKEGKKK